MPEPAVGQRLDGVEAAGERLAAADGPVAAGRGLDRQAEAEPGQPRGPDVVAAAGPRRDRFGRAGRPPDLAPAGGVQGQRRPSVGELGRGEQAAARVEQAPHAPGAPLRRQRRDPVDAAGARPGQVHHPAGTGQPGAAVAGRREIGEGVERRVGGPPEHGRRTARPIELEQLARGEDQHAIDRPRDELRAGEAGAEQLRQRDRGPAVALEELEPAELAGAPARQEAPDLPGGALADLQRRTGGGELAEGVAVVDGERVDRARRARPRRGLPASARRPRSRTREGRRWT